MKEPSKLNKLAAAAITKREAEMAAQMGDMSAGLSVASFEPTHAYNMAIWGVKSKNDSLVRMVTPGQKVSTVEDDKGNRFRSSNEFLTPIEKIETVSKVETLSRSGETHTTAIENFKRIAFNPTHIYFNSDDVYGSSRHLQNKPVEIVESLHSGFVKIKFEDGLIYGADLKNIKLIVEETAKSEPVTRKGKISSDRVHLTFQTKHTYDLQICDLVLQAFGVQLTNVQTTLIVRPSQFGRFVVLMATMNEEFAFNLSDLNLRLVAESAKIIDASTNPNTIRGEVA